MHADVSYFLCCTRKRNAIKEIGDVYIQAIIKPAVLICRRCICDVAASTAWDTSRTNKNMRPRQLEPSQSFTAGMPAKLNLSQPRRYAGGKDSDEQCCRLLLFSEQYPRQYRRPCRMCIVYRWAGI